MGRGPQQAGRSPSLLLSKSVRVKLVTWPSGLAHFPSGESLLGPRGLFTEVLSRAWGTSHSVALSRFCEISQEPARSHRWLFEEPQTQ